MKKVQIYTDGACSGNPGPGGYAAILIYDKHEKEIWGYEDNTTNNRMELMAPIKALSMLKTKCEVEIYSDSAYVVNSFNMGWIYAWKKNGWKKDKGQELKNVDLLQKLYALCQKHKVTWHKVKGHSDNEYNNRCDALAVNAIKELIKNKKGNNENSGFYEGDLKETVISIEEIFKGKVFDVNVLQVKMPDDTVARREIVSHPGGAAICAVDDEGYVYTVVQYRIATSGELIEIPAGKVEKGEDPKECAKRELAEETGLIAKEVRHIVSFYATPGYCTEMLHIYLATGLEEGNLNRDEGEFLHVRKYKIDELMRMIQNGEITDGKTIIAAMWAKMNWR
jgi:ribonuclease HI